MFSEDPHIALGYMNEVYRNLPEGSRVGREHLWPHSGVSLVYLVLEKLRSGLDPCLDANQKLSDWFSKSFVILIFYSKANVAKPKVDLHL